MGQDLAGRAAPTNAQQIIFLRRQFYSRGSDTLTMRRTRSTERSPERNTGPLRPCHPASWCRNAARAIRASKLVHSRTALFR